MQNLIVNHKYKIKTKFGWEDFRGIVKTEENKKSLKLTYKSGNFLSCTLDHRIHSEHGLKKAQDIIKGERIVTIDDTFEVVDTIEYFTLPVVYDIFNSESHTIIANTTHITQCDELSFVSHRIAHAFWTSIFSSFVNRW